MEAAVTALVVAVLWLEGISRTSLLKFFVLCVWWGNTDILQLTVTKHTHGGGARAWLGALTTQLPLLSSMMQSRRPEGLHQLSYAQATEATCASAVFWMGAGIVALEKVDTFTGSQRREPPGKVLSGWCGNTSNIYSTRRSTGLTWIKKEVTFCPWEQYSERLRTLRQKNWFWFRNQICRLNFFSWVKYEIRVTCKFPFLFSF